MDCERGRFGNMEYKKLGDGAIKGARHCNIGGSGVCIRCDWRNAHLIITSSNVQRIFSDIRISN